MSYVVNIDKYKVIDNILVSLLIFFPVMAILAYPIAYWPHYEKKVYEKQEPLTWESMVEIHQQNVEKYDETWTTNFSGYPTEGMNTDLSTYEQFANDENDNFCLEVNAENLKPTGVYQRVYEYDLVARGGNGVGLRRSESVGTSNAEKFLTNYFKTVLNRSKAIYAQYYALTLSDGHQILILLNDTMLNIPKEGIIRLPFANKEGLRLDEIENSMEKLVQKYGLDYEKTRNRVEVLNASRGWLLINEDIEAAHEDRAMLFALLLCVGIGGTMITFLGAVLLLKREK